MVALETMTGADELLGEMLDLHGEGLARVWASLEPATRERLAADPVVGQMLLVHGMHPVPLEERVGIALARVRPYLESHGGDVQLLSLEEGVAHLLLKGSCNGCASSASTLELAIERALDDEAPDLLRLEVEGVGDAARTPAGRMPARTLPMAGSGPGANSGWFALTARPEPGRMIAADGGLLVANVAGTLLAYRDACAGCGASLLDGELDEGTLECSSCRRRFSLPLAGRSLAPEDLQLEPVPLLDDGRRVQVAV
jgi:Fe-S cluster biogenesis protein NfuA